MDEILSFFTDDGLWEALEGTFKGKEQIKRYVNWNKQTTPALKITETGIKIIAEGDVVVYEHVLSGTVQGATWEALAICIYEFAGDKTKGVRTLYNRLTMARRLTKGFLAKRAVNSIISAMERGSASVAFRSKALLTCSKVQVLKYL